MLEPPPFFRSSFLLARCVAALWQFSNRRRSRRSAANDRLNTPIGSPPSPSRPPTARWPASAGKVLLYRPGEVLLWNPADGKLKASLDGHATTVWSVAFSPDGKTLATGGYDGIIKLWEMPSGKPLHELKKHKHWTRALGVHARQQIPRLRQRRHDRDRLGRGDRQRRENDPSPRRAGVWRRRFARRQDDRHRRRRPFGQALGFRQRQRERAKLEGHQDAVWTVAYRKDGSLLATAGADRVVKLWSPDGKPQGELTGHKDWILTRPRFRRPTATCWPPAATTTRSKLWDVGAKRNRNRFR